MIDIIGNTTRKRPSGDKNIISNRSDSDIQPGDQIGISQTLDIKRMPEKRNGRTIINDRSNEERRTDTVKDNPKTKGFKKA